MTITKELLELTIQKIASASLPAIVDENYDINGKEPFELYNAIVGTTFNAENYNTVATEAPDYLFAHIPGGAKMVGEMAESLDITGDDKVTEADVAAIDAILAKDEITESDITTGDVTGDFKVDEHDKELIEKEAECQKSTVEVETEPENPGESPTLPIEEADPDGEYDAD